MARETPPWAVSRGMPEVNCSFPSGAWQDPSMPTQMKAEAAAALTRWARGSMEVSEMRGRWFNVPGRIWMDLDHWVSCYITSLEMGYIRGISPNLPSETTVTKAPEKPNFRRCFFRNFLQVGHAIIFP